MSSSSEAGRSFRHHFEGPFWRKVLVTGLRAMPQSVQRATIPYWAGLFWGAVPRARRSIEENLAQILGPGTSRAQLHLRSYRLFVNYAQAITNLYVMHLGQRLPVDPEFVGYEKLKPILDARRGAVAVTAHLGYWQITPFLCARRKWLPPITMAMAEEPNRKLAAFEAELRAKLRIVYTTASPFSAIELANIIRRGELVGMQMDRHIGGAAYAMIDFCGRPAPFPTGPATLARATGAPLVPVFVIAGRDRRRCTVHLETPLEVAHTRDRNADVVDATRRLVAVYERYVKAYPEQWFNFHDFWAEPPQPLRPHATTTTTATASTRGRPTAATTTTAAREVG
jgi:KDO2-lipid IV(A) lauroyltransferase